MIEEVKETKYFYLKAIGLLSVLSLLLSVGMVACSGSSIDQLGIAFMIIISFYLLFALIIVIGSKIEKWVIANA